jgi:hypothetical protein
MAEESSFQGLNLKNSLAVVEAVGMWESRSDFQGGGETRRVSPVDTANSIRVFGGWTLQIQTLPISGMRHREVEITAPFETHKDEKRPRLE